MWLQDYFGREIELTQERWQHIIKEHPELEKLKDRIAGALSDLDYVKRSKRDDKVELFYSGSHLDELQISGRQAQRGKVRYPLTVDR